MGGHHAKPLLFVKLLAEAALGSKSKTAFLAAATCEQRGRSAWTGRRTVLARTDEVIEYSGVFCCSALVRDWHLSDLARCPS
jgi:hypothetical protein